MGNLSKLELLLNLGFKSDPFKATLFETSDSARIKRIMYMAVNSNAMVSVVGERGAGKTRAVNAALKELKARPVIVRSADKARLLISDIEQAMILDLSEEKPKRGREIRARQLRRVLGEASRKQRIVVVIEEGHRLHGMTLRALKTLREMDWMGETELFSVVLLGQSDPMNKAGVAEVRLRSDSVEMNGMSAVEIVTYINKTVGAVFEKEAAYLVGSLPEARNFLGLQNILYTLMGHAVSDGRKQVTQADACEVFGIDMKKQDLKKASPADLKSNGDGDSKRDCNTALLSVLSKKDQADNACGLKAV